MKNISMPHRAFIGSAALPVSKVAAVCCFGLALGVTPPAAAFGGGAPEDPAIVGEVTIRVGGPAQLKQAIAALSKEYAGVGQIDEIPGRNTYLLSYTLLPGQTLIQVENSLNTLQANGVIAMGELNYGAQAAEGKTGSLWVSQVTLGAPQYVQQYAWDLIGLTDAHERSTGYGTIVAVLDTGIDAAHPVLANRVLGAGVSFVGEVSANTEIVDGVDSDNDGQFDEMYGHGTFVAGLIALVAPDAKLLSARVLDDDGHGDLFSIAKAMYWSIDAGADVINMSLGSTYHAFAMEEAATEALSKGILVVGAAGNVNTDDPREFPACDSASVGVAATDRFDVKAPFSNFEDKLDFSAPGHSEPLAGNPGLYDPAKSIISIVPNGGYAAWKGTSMSTALVSGSIALVRAQHPAWPSSTVPIELVAPTILGVLASTAADIDQNNPAYQEELGKGRIDCAAATAAGPVQPLPGDVNLDGSVGAADLSILLGAWGQCTGSCPADLDFDGTIGSADLALLLGAWG